MIAASGHPAAATFPLLTTVVVLPAVGALVVSLLSRRRPELSRTIGLIFSVITGAVSIAILVGFDRHEAGFQMVEKVTWIRDLDIAWHLGVDGISLFLVVLTGVLFPLSILGIDPHNADPRQDKPYFAWLLLLETGVMGSFISLDLFLFFVSFDTIVR